MEKVVPSHAHFFLLLFCQALAYLSIKVSVILSPGSACTSKDMADADDTPRDFNVLSNSLAFWNRLSGSFSMARWMMLIRSFEATLLRLRNGFGVSCACCCMMARGVLPSKGTSPATIS